MPSNVIQFVIKAIDQTKTAFNSASSRLKSFGNGAMSMLKKIGSYAKWAFVGMAAGVTLAVREYLNYSRAVAKLDVTLQKESRQNEITKKSMLELADSLQKTAGVEDEAVINAEAILLTYKKISGKIIPDVVKAIVNMNMAMTDGDVSISGLQASAVMLGRALSDPKKAITMLAKAGVILDVEQKKAIKSALAHKDISKAQTVILAALEEKYGGMAKAISKSQAGVDRVKGSFGDLVKEIGRVILVGFGLEKGANAISNAMDRLTESGNISKWGANLVGWVKDALGQVAKLSTYLDSIFKNEKGELDIGGGFLQLGKDLGLGILKVLWDGAVKLGTYIGEGVTNYIREKLKGGTRTPEEQILEKQQMQIEKDFQAYARHMVEEQTGTIVDPRNKKMREGRERQIEMMRNSPTYGGTGPEGFSPVIKSKAEEQYKKESEREFAKIVGENKRKQAVVEPRKDSVLNRAIAALDIGEKSLNRDAAIQRLSGVHGFDYNQAKEDLKKAKRGEVVSDKLRRTRPELEEMMRLNAESLKKPTPEDDAILYELQQINKNLTAK